jgi:hypothetical protein
MPRRLIICTDSAKGVMNGVTAEERNIITHHLELKGFQVWHWFEDLWLVVDPANGSSTSSLREELSGLLGPGNLKHIIIMNIEGNISFSGIGPPDGWPWMLKNWGKTE